MTVRPSLALLAALATTVAGAASDPPRTIRKLEAAAAERPGDPAPLERLAKAYADLGDWEAVAGLPSRVTGQPSETRYRVSRAAAMAICDGPGCGKAAPILKELVQLSLDDADGDLDRAMEAASRGARDQSAAALEEFLERRPPAGEVAFALRVVSDQLIRCHRCCRPDNPPAPGWRLAGLEDGPGLIAPGNIPVEVETPESRKKDPSLRHVLVYVDGILLRSGHWLPYRLGESTDDDWAEAVIRAMRGTAFEPARLDGEPVATPRSFRYRRN